MYTLFCIFIEKDGKHLNIITRTKYKNRGQTIAQQPGEDKGEWSLLICQELLGFSALGDCMMLISRSQV